MVKVKVKGHVIRALFWILGMSYSVIDGLVINLLLNVPGTTNFENQSAFTEVMIKNLVVVFGVNYHGNVVVVDGISNKTESSKFPRPS